MIITTNQMWQKRMEKLFSIHRISYINVFTNETGKHFVISTNKKQYTDTLNNFENYLPYKIDDIAIIIGIRLSVSTIDTFYADVVTSVGGYKGYLVYHDINQSIDMFRQISNMGG